MKIIPAKGLNKWANTKTQESPIKGISQSLITRYGLFYILEHMRPYLEDNKDD